MKWCAPLVMFGILHLSSIALAQMSPLGSSGDFRVEGRPGTDPTVGPPGGPSLPTSSASFLDSLGGRSPDEILKNIDKDLVKGASGGAELQFRSPSPDLGKDFLPPSPHDTLK
ncbi:MAG TPA: hypothetical protein VIU63_11005 [Nitrospira sp.]